jgi:hypothetical protein
MSTGSSLSESGADINDTADKGRYLLKPGIDGACAIDVVGRETHEPFRVQRNHMHVGIVEAVPQRS